MICASENLLKGDALNLEQVIAASCRRLACRMVGDRRMIVEYRQELLIIQIQGWSKKRWITDVNSGGRRYPIGILRDDAGRYLCILDDPSDVVWIRACLPLCCQALLLPECNDWQVME
jgi:hypothetical protein